MADQIPWTPENYVEALEKHCDALCKASDEVFSAFNEEHYSSLSTRQNLAIDDMEDARHWYAMMLKPKCPLSQPTTVRIAMRTGIGVATWLSFLLFVFGAISPLATMIIMSVSVGFFILSLINCDDR